MGYRPRENVRKEQVDHVRVQVCTRAEGGGMRGYRERMKEQGLDIYSRSRIGETCDA